MLSKHEIQVGVDEEKLTLYIGEDGKLEFFKDLDSINAKGEVLIQIDEESREYAQGLAYSDNIWLESWNLRILLHEMQHYLDSLFQELTIVNEVEAKAIFMSNILEKVLVLRDKELT